MNWSLTWDMDGMQWTVEKIQLWGDNKLKQTEVMGEYEECLLFIHDHLLNGHHIVEEIDVICDEGTYKLPIFCVEEILKEHYPEIMI